jgi:hypothetical protein
MGTIVARLDELGMAAWIGLMVISFILFWPVGLAVLAFLIWSGRMGCWKHGRAGRWQQDMKARMHERWHGGRSNGSSGNWAFDEYRAETLKRLEEEQEEFRQFLERLRHAKDKAEFDDFMADRRRNREGPEPQAQA